MALGHFKKLSFHVPLKFIGIKDWLVEQGSGNNAQVKVSVFILCTTLIFLRVEHFLCAEHICVVQPNQNTCDVSLIVFLRSSACCFSAGVIYTADILDRETTKSYWLTVYATDHGVVPLYTTIEVYIEVEDVNDNAPLTSEPIYYPTVMENSPKDVSVIQIQAQDPDSSTNEKLTYRITSGNPQNFFVINPKTGNKILLPYGGGNMQFKYLSACCPLVSAGVALLSKSLFSG